MLHAHRGRRGSEVKAIVIGAGPYGLAATAHLRGAGVSTSCFGEPLSFWRTRMPEGMVLRSTQRSTSIASPQRTLSLGDYELATGRRLHAPHLQLEEFVDYGLWYQRRAVADVDERKVRIVTADGPRFELELEDGEQLCADTVIVAAGLRPFPRWPDVFTPLAPRLASHASEHRDLSFLSGLRVAVIGEGQSALESAALLNERGAEVEVLARSETIRWLGDGEPDNSVKPALSTRLRAPTDVGGLVSGWIAATPDMVRAGPEALRSRLSDRCSRPAGAASLRPRLTAVKLSCGQSVTGAERSGEEAHLRLSDGSERIVDHVLLGTGYDVDVRRYPFLDQDLRAGLSLAAGYPVLGPGYESSIPGLHFLGAPASHSFGPVTRFIVGTWHAAPALTRRVLGVRSGRSRSRSETRSQALAICCLLTVW